MTDRDPEVLALVEAGERAFDERRFDAAAESARRALAADPGCAAAHQLVGMVCHERGQIPAGMAAFARAVALRPDLSRSHNGLGRFRFLLGDLAAALACYETALRLEPDFPVARFNRAAVLLKTGRLRDGWIDYESRWRAGVAVRPTIPRPRWDGSPLAGRSILVHTEQGFGDAIQFVRFLAVLKARGARVVFACQTALRPLLAGVGGVDEWFPIDRPGPITFDVHASLMSLPGLLGIDDVQAIPRAPAYLWADPARVDRWRPTIAALPGLKVGLAWQGSTTFADDRFRSVPPAALSPLAGVAGVSFVRLQKGMPTGPDDPAQPAVPMAMLAGADVDAALVDTAAAMACLDLVITSDSAVAHLAGALGRPTWVLLSAASEWRWLADRADSPWYPSTRLFRQRTLGDWAGVVDDVRAALAVAVAAGIVPPVATAGVAGPPVVPVSTGELADRLTILRLKAERFADPAQVANVRRELALVEAACRHHLPATAEVERLVAELADVNRLLWDTEDAFHAHHAAGDFGPAFVAHAKGVVEANARRSAAKRRISEACGSTLVEEKSYGRPA